jgi:hypothetical protein
MHISRSLVVAFGAVVIVVGASCGGCKTQEPVVIDSSGRRTTVAALSPEERMLRAEQDVVRFQRESVQAQQTARRIEENAALFNRDDTQPLTADERDRAWALFADVVDHAISLDGMTRFHINAWRTDWTDLATGDERAALHFLVGFGAYVEKHALVLNFVERSINKSQFEKLLDEDNPKYGIQKGTYGEMKLKVIHVSRVVKVLGAHQYAKIFATKLDAIAAKSKKHAYLRERMEERYQLVKATLKEHPVELFAGNSADIAGELGHAAWFPVQANSAEWLGDTRVKSAHDMLISIEQVKEAAAKCEPGDVIVERRNWFLSNIGLPGFWPHAALWVGTPEDLAAYFDGDTDVTKKYGMKFSDFLKEKYPEAVKNHAAVDHERNPHRILEAVSEGVVFNAAEESIRADYVAAMRPRLPKIEKAMAVERAFAYAGRPYDFDFDFYTDSALVCSELVYKAYEPREGMAGLSFTLENMVGRMTLGPNAMVRSFDERYGTGQQQLDFVWFLDGREQTHSAVAADLAAFRGSHARPKWDIVQK